MLFYILAKNKYMKNKYILILNFLAISLSLNAQDISQGDMQINSGLDLLSSGSAKPFTNIKNRLRGDLDFNYFLQDRFAVGIGFDYSTSLTQLGFSPGIRYYWLDKSFFRTKLNIPTNFSGFDISLGVGYNYMISDNWGLESNMDYFIKGERAVFRMGIAVFI